MRGAWYFMGAVFAALFHTVVLGSLIEGRASILRDGEPVLLKTVPVDPRDLFRGKYIQLNYEISALDPALFSDLELTKDEGLQEVFVVLERDESGHGQAVGVFNEAPDLLENEQVVLRGTVPRFATSDETEPARPIRVRYGIEQFFVPEGDAIAIEREYRDDAILVSIGVAAMPDGRVQIRKILINGKSRYAEPLY